MIYKKLGSLGRLGVDFSFDSRLARYLLLSTVEDNEIATIHFGLYGQTYLVDDETFYGKGVKRAFTDVREILGTFGSEDCSFWSKQSLAWQKTQ